MQNRHTNFVFDKFRCILHKNVVEFFRIEFFFSTSIIISKITLIIIRRTNARKIFFKKIVKVTRKRERIKNDTIKWIFVDFFVTRLLLRVTKNCRKKILNFLKFLWLNFFLFLFLFITITIERENDKFNKCVKLYEKH